jgi:hypothetical protein
MVQAEIHDLNRAAGDDLAAEIRVESQFRDELREQLKTMQKTVAKFAEHRSDVLGALNRELEDSAGKGYLKLLGNELKELKVLLARS